MRTPSRVRLVSAIEVARTSLRRPGGDGGDRGALGGGIEAAVEAVQVDIGRQRGRAARRSARSRRRRAGRRAGRPRSRPARGGSPPPSRPRSASRQRGRDGSSSIGMAAALALDHRRVAHQRGEAGAVERRRHGEEAQVGAQRGLRVEREGEAEIAVEAALVHLVEQHGGDAGKLRIGLDALQEDAFGEDGDPGRAPSACCRAGSHSRSCRRPARRPAPPSARPRRARRGGAATAAGSRRRTRARRAKRARPPSSCRRRAARRARRCFARRKASSRPGSAASIGSRAIGAP